VRRSLRQGLARRLLLVLVQLLQAGEDAVRSQMVDVEVEVVQLFDAHVVECNGIVTDTFNTLTHTHTHVPINV